MKKLKGFTLIECIIAMALIGMTSLLMVQVYGTVAMMNRDNNMMNNSIDRQMQYAEKQLTEVATSGSDDGVVKIIELTSYDKPGAAGKVGEIEIRMDGDLSKNPNCSKFDIAKPTGTPYKAEIDLYVIGLETTSAAADEYNTTGVESYDNNHIRYKFIKPKPHPTNP